MGGEGYAIFHGIECIYVIGTDEIRLIPKNPDDIRKLNCHFDDRNFYFHYSDSVDKNQVAYIKKVKMNIGHSLSLIPLYSVKLFKKAPVSSIEMTGPAIDEFFSPAGYFYNKHISGNKTNHDSHRPNISSVISAYKQPSKSAQSIEITGFIEKSKPSQIIFLYTLLPLTA